MDSEKGFILTRSAFDNRGVCTLKYIGRSNSGIFEIIINSHKPLFFIHRSTEIPNLPGMDRRQVELQSFSDKDVDALYFESLNYYYEGRRTLHNKQITMFESDIRPADRFLMERFINGSVEIIGQKRLEGENTVWINPQLKPCDYIPELKWLSIDIETEPIKKFGNNGLLYSIAAHGIFKKNEIKKVFVLAPEGTYKNSTIVPGIENAEIGYNSNEKDLILSFLKFVKNWDPDLIIGWHVIGFDIK
ncbi:MAG: 3'-5' exonuclease, partial [Spirochaetota bacterium]|nr:3'-5' exonuclease [Spirochaetota bacterium]